MQVSAEHAAGLIWAPCLAQIDAAAMPGSPRLLRRDDLPPPRQLLDLVAKTGRGRYRRTGVCQSCAHRGPNKRTLPAGGVGVGAGAQGMFKCKSRMMDDASKQREGPTNGRRAWRGTAHTPRAAKQCYQHKPHAARARIWLRDQRVALCIAWSERDRAIRDIRAGLLGI